jgi:hypothetical protein
MNQHAAVLKDTLVYIVNITQQILTLEILFVHKIFYLANITGFASPLSDENIDILLDLYSFYSDYKNLISPDLTEKIETLASK